jgi:5-methyltetrahydropteroyltriglutamate--homocysteine methyltransferase
MKQTLAELPILPTSAVGSHAPTGWLLTAIDAIGRGELGRDDVDELMRDATDIAVLDMERAGLDVLVDGEMRRNDFNLGFYVRLQGIEPLPPGRKLGPEGHDQRGKWRVFAEVSAPDGLGCAGRLSGSGRGTAPETPLRHRTGQAGPVPRA